MHTVCISTFLLWAVFWYLNYVGDKVKEKLFKLRSQSGIDSPSTVQRAQLKFKEDKVSDLRGHSVKKQQSVCSHYY